MTSAPPLGSPASADPADVTFSSPVDPLYVLFCPCGVEEVARAELELIASSVLSRELSTGNHGVCIWSAPPAVKGLGPPSPPDALRNGSDQPRRSKAPRDRSAAAAADLTDVTDTVSIVPSAEAAARHLHGAVFFQLDQTVWTSTRVAELFLALFRLARSVEMCAVHLLSTPCAEQVAELEAPLSACTAHIHQTVLGAVGGLRATLGRLAVVRRLADQIALLGPSYMQPLLDSEVLFRVNCVRRDKSVRCAFSSQDVAAHVGDQLMTHFESRGWRVSMVYHNLEFFVLHDARVAHVCAALSPPALPRCGSETGVSETSASSQFLMEYVRQRLTRGLLDATYTAAELKARIPRPSSHRVELRRFKGENAMHPALAKTLIACAALQPEMVVLDPFVGSGTVLVEAVVDLWQPHATPAATTPGAAGGVLVLGGEHALKDASRTAENLRLPHLLALGAVHGLISTVNGPNDDAPSGDTCLSAWIAQLRTAAKAVDVATELKAGQALVATDALEDALERAVRTLCTPSPPPVSGAYAFTAFRADATRLPLRANTVDRVVTDMPFGRRCGNHGVNRRLYPRFLRECHRVLRRPTTAPSSSENETSKDAQPPAMGVASPWLVATADPCRLQRVREAASSGRGRAVLLTIEGRLLYEALAEVRAECPFQLVAEPFAVDMGGLFPYVFVLDKL